MAGSLQQNVRALMVRASSPMPSSERHEDEVARLRAQLHHAMRTNHDMRGMLQNQALAIEQFQSRWQMAGQEAHAFVARARSESEDFLRTELGAIERFEDRTQRQYDGELRKHVHALQDKCREHVGQEESKLRNELTHALTHESQVCKEEEVLSHQEVAQLRSLVAAQQEELGSIHHDCAELQRKSATTEAHEERALYQNFDSAIKEKDAQVHALQHELSRMQEKQRIQLKADRLRLRALLRRHKSLLMDPPQRGPPLQLRRQPQSRTSTHPTRRWARLLVTLVAPYRAIPRDYLSDTPLLRAMGFLVSQHGQLGAIPPPPFLCVSFLESMRSGGAIPPLKRGISAILARYPKKTRQMGAIPPSAILSRKGIAR